MLKRAVSFIAMYVVLSLFAALALLVDTWPLYPRSALVWLLLLVIAFPVTVLGDWLSDRALSSSVALVVERSGGSQLSWLRLGYCLALYVLFAICAVVILYWLQSPPV